MEPFQLVRTRNGVGGRVELAAAQNEEVLVL
jgi:hypothetical protein